MSDGSVTFQRDLGERDLKQIAFLYNAAEVIGGMKKGLRFSRQQRRQGRKTAEEMLSHIMKGAFDETQKSERAIGVFDGDNLNAFVFFGPNLSPTPLHELARRIRFKDLSSLNRLSQIARAENTGEIRYLYVAEEAQGRGLGTSLFSTAAQELRETGYEHMRLITESDNDQARRFYEKLGGQTTAMPVTRDAYGTSMIAYRWSFRSSSNLGARP